VNAALCLLLYAGALTVISPPILNRISEGGLTPRLSVVVWLSVIGLVLAALPVAAIGLLAHLVGGHHVAPARYCVDLVLMLHRLGWPGDAALVAMAVGVIAAAAVVLRRLSSTLRTLWTRSHEHADAARILGSSTLRPGVVVLPADRPAAYCVAGRPHAIVVTTAAVETLPEAQLAAVVAHERAHLDGWHPQVMMFLRGLAAVLPRIPLFPAAVISVGGLVEMWADDVAARRCGREVLLGGLVTLAGQPRAAGGAMGIADTAVAQRVTRLAWPVCAQARLRQRVLLVATLTVFVCLPGAIAWICHS
jgi:Zn-dependent protease with chaperone function